MRRRLIALFSAAILTACTSTGDEPVPAPSPTASPTLPAGVLPGVSTLEDPGWSFRNCLELAWEVTIPNTEALKWRYINQYLGHLKASHDDAGLLLLETKVRAANHDTRLAALRIDTGELAWLSDPTQVAGCSNLPNNDKAVCLATSGDLFTIDIAGTHTTIANLAPEQSLNTQFIKRHDGLVLYSGDATRYTDVRAIDTTGTQLWHQPVEQTIPIASKESTVTTSYAGDLVAIEQAPAPGGMGEMPKAGEARSFATGELLATGPAQAASPKAMQLGIDGTITAAGEGRFEQTPPVLQDYTFLHSGSEGVMVTSDRNTVQGCPDQTSASCADLPGSETTPRNDVSLAFTPPSLVHVSGQPHVMQSDRLEDQLRLFPLAGSGQAIATAADNIASFGDPILIDGYHSFYLYFLRNGHGDRSALLDLESGESIPVNDESRSARPIATGDDWLLLGDGPASDTLRLYRAKR